MENILVEEPVFETVPAIILYIITALLVIGALTIIAYLFKYRNHSNLKKYSPGFSCLTILGLIMNILSPVFLLYIKSYGQCKFRYIYETVDTCLILMPMVAITLRNYYNSKSGNNKRFTKRLMLFVIAILFIMSIYSFISVFIIVKFDLKSYGQLPSLHLYTCNYETGIVLDIIERIIYTLIFLAMAILVFMTRKVSKEHVKYRYVFIMLFILAIEVVKELFSSHLTTSVSYLILYTVYMIGYFICIYILIGNEVVSAIKNPNPDNLDSE